VESRDCGIRVKSREINQTRFSPIRPWHPNVTPVVCQDRIAYVVW
jgi:hypothetical protein